MATKLFIQIKNNFKINNSNKIKIFKSNAFPKISFYNYCFIFDDCFICYRCEC